MREMWQLNGAPDLRPGLLPKGGRSMSSMSDWCMHYGSIEESAVNFLILITVLFSFLESVHSSTKG
jgi:large-conductance mechanosensitive channel